MPGPDRESVLWRAAADLARARGETDAATALARAVGMLLDAAASQVWMIDHAHGYRVVAGWPDRPTGDEDVPRELPRAVVLGTAEAGGARRGVRSSLVLPLVADGRPLGGIEVVEKKREAGPLTAGEAQDLGGLLQAAAASLEAARKTAALERSHLETVERLTRLFDVGRSLGSTLDAGEISEIAVNRVLRALEVDGVYLWLPDGDEGGLRVAAAAGATAEQVEGWTLAAGEGLAGQVASTRETVRVADSEEIPEIDARLDLQDEVPIGAVAAAPLVRDDEGPLEGVIEIVRFGEDASIEGAEVLLLEEIARTAALAFANARHLEAERRASDLSALLDVAKDLGSSLDPSEVAYTLAHKAAAVLQFGMSAVGILKGGRLEMEAVSGQDFVDPALPRNVAMRDVLAYAATLDAGFYAVRDAEGEVDADRAETRERLKAYFEATGTASFLAVPLQDDDGKMGVFGLDAEEPYAFSAHDIEAVTLLGVQATVAIRNAVLFRDMPKRGVLAPFAKRTRRTGAASASRRTAWIAGGIVAAVLLAIPVPLRVGGEARVLPVRRVATTAEIDGRVARVLVREGDLVRAGRPVAELDDAEARGARDEARGRLDAAVREQARLRASGDVAEAAVLAARVDGLRAEVDLQERLLERTTLRAASSGIVATPRVEETVGTRMQRGDVFCEIVDPKDQAIEIDVPEADASLVAPGMPVKVKLQAYPTASLAAVVDRVGVSVQLVDGDRVLRVRAALDGDAPPLRTAMSGRAKITTRWSPAARVLLRRPARWLWATIWGWLP